MTRTEKARFSEEQIIEALKQADAGVVAEELCRKRGISQNALYSLKGECGGMEPFELRHLKELGS